MNSPRRAFTLVEILVVLAIIAILCALLLSAFSRARGQAQRTACASNLRQLAEAMHLYLQDNGGAFPFDQTTETVNGVASSTEWNDRLAPTQPIAEIIHCPAFPENVRWDSKTSDYRLGRDLSERVVGHKIVSEVVFESQFPQPTTTELFNEKVTDTSNGRSPVAREVPSQRCGNQFMFNMHLDGANITYLDGHIKWVSAERQGQRDEACERE